MDPNEPQQLNQPSEPGFGDHWKQWLQEPANRTALMQAGIALMQPIGVGQTFGGHVADAAGQGLEAKGRAEATELETQKTEAETQRATASAARAEEGMNISRERLEISRSKEGRLAKGKGLSSLFKSPAHRESAIQKAYATLAQKAEEASLFSGTPVKKEELLSNPEWLQQNRRSAEMTAGAADTTDVSPAPGAEGTTPSAPQQTGAPPFAGKVENEIQKNKSGARFQWKQGKWVQLTRPTSGN